MTKKQTEQQSQLFKGRSPLLSLPVDLIKEILLKLDDVPSVIHLLATNKELKNSIDKDQSFWKSMYLKHIGDPKDKISDYRKEFIAEVSKKRTFESTILTQVKPLYEKAMNKKYGDLFSFMIGEQRTIQGLSTMNYLVEIHKANIIASRYTLVPDRILKELKSSMSLKPLVQAFSKALNKDQVKNDVTTFFKNIGVKNYSPNMSVEKLKEEIGEIIEEKSPESPKPGT